MKGSLSKSCSQREKVEHFTYHVDSLGEDASWAYLPPHAGVIKHGYSTDFCNYFCNRKRESIHKMPSAAFGMT